MKTFIKQIEKNFGFPEIQIMKTLHIHSADDNTFLAVVAVRNKDDKFLHYDIIYKFKEMRKPVIYGYYQDVYNNDGDLVYNGYAEAIEEMKKYI